MASNKLFILFNSLLLLILGGSIVLNILLYNQAKKYYLQVNETRLDPFGLNHYPINLKKQNDKVKKAEVRRQEAEGIPTYKYEGFNNVAVHLFISMLESRGFRPYGRGQRTIFVY